MSGGIWDLSSQPRIGPESPALEAWSLNHWAARGVPWRDLTEICELIRLLSVYALPSLGMTFIFIVHDDCES